MRRGAPCVVLSVLAAVATVVACRDATQVLVEARTDVPARPLIVTAFTFGAPGETEDADSTTETREVWGPDGLIGTIGVVPSGDPNATLSVKIVMGVKRDPRGCSIASPKGCIFARRKLRYSPHELLQLPVFLYSRCEDIPCDPNSTCNYLGQCVPSDVDPGSCASSTGCTIPGEPDPTKPRPDASTDDSSDGPTDASKTDAASKDGSSDDASASDGGDPDADAGQPSGPTIMCGGQNCVGKTCCYTLAGMTGRCIDIGQACNGGEYTIRCDDALDCAGVGQCCIAGQGTQCSMTCAGGATGQVCGGGACVGGGTCTGNFAGYGTCQ